MARPRGGFTSTDAWIAVGIAATTALLAGAVLLSAERVKRDEAELIVNAIAAANRKRRAAGKDAVVGRVDDSSVLVASGEIEPQEWANLPYVFTGAESAKDACILAVAARRPDGPGGPVQPPYSQWGVCATAKGDVAAFAGSCALDCKEPAPESQPAPPPPPQPAPPPPVVKPAPAPVVHKTVTVAPPELPKEDVKPAARTGCSITGCFGTDCCEEESDSCVSCPGNACCVKRKGCGGSCREEDDCLQGCACSKIPGSPTGTCR